MKNLNIVHILLLQMIFASCGSKDECGYRPDEVEQVFDISIERTESEILNLDTREKIRDFIKREPLITENFLLRGDYPNDSIFVEELYRMLSNPYIDSLELEIQRIFPDLDWLEKELEDAYNLLHHYYPETRPPKIKTVASGFGHDMLVTDTVIVIGLEYYMGDEAKYRPRGVYNYMLRRYQPKFIVPTIMLLTGISTKFNKVDKQDVSMIADMISYGKAFYFAKRMLPCTPDSTLIWYSDKEMIGLNAYKDIVWSHFIEENLLWESSHIIKRKYLDPRPKTYEVGVECPPRVGTWLGWEIVKKYMEDHPDTSLQELMLMSDPRKLFEEARYRPD